MNWMSTGIVLINQYTFLKLKMDGHILWTFKGGAFFGLSSQAWTKLANGRSVIYVYYDDGLNAELIVIKNGALIREFSLYEDEPDANVNFGAFEYEEHSPIKDWNDVVTILDKEFKLN